MSGKNFGNLANNIQEINVKITRFPDIEYCEEFYAVQGNTYPVKDYLKNLGLKWHSSYKVWYFHAQNELQFNEIVEKIKTIPNINLEIQVEQLPKFSTLFNSFEELVEKSEYGKCILCGKTEKNMLRIELYKKTNTKLDSLYEGIVISVCSCIGNGEEFHYKLFKIKKHFNVGINRIERLNTDYIDNDIKEKIKERNKEYLAWLNDQLKKIPKNDR
jgi:hypothetical protein